MWIYFGPPKHFSSGNGGEFNNKRYQQMNEKLNIETCTRAAASQFTNGTVEHRNLRIPEAMEKQ